MIEKKLVRNLAAGAIIIILVIIASMIFLVVSSRNGQADLVKSASYGDLEFSYSPTDLRVLGSSKESFIECNRGDLCLINTARTDSEVQTSLVFSRLDVGVNECLASSVRLDEQPVGPQIAELLLADFSPETGSSLSDDLILDKRMRIFVNKDCYQIAASVSPSRMAGDLSGGRLASRTVYGFDQLLDVINSIQVANHRSGNISTMTAEWSDEVQKVIGSNASLTNWNQDSIDTNIYPGYKVGEVVYSDDDIEVVVLGVINDSRCPIDVQCIQAGEVVVEFRVLNKSNQSSFNVSVSEGENFATSQTNGSDSPMITLVQVLPKRSLDREISSGDYRFEVTEAKSADPVAATSCVRAGCSGQLCISETEAEAGGGVSTCEYRDEYACYQAATCEVQSNGTCGFTDSPDLESCLADSSEVEN